MSLIGDIKRFWNAKRGVSNGVVTLSLITIGIVLAGAAIAVSTGGFVFLSSPSPATDFSADREVTTVTVSHGGGDVISPENTGALIVDDVDEDSVTWISENINGDGAEGEITGNIQTGDEIFELDVESKSESQVELIWESEDGESSELFGSVVIGGGGNVGVGDPIQPM